MNEILATSIAYWKSAVLFTALKWNLFERLGERKLTIEAIASLCQVENDTARRILRALCAMKLLIRADGLYTCAGTSLDFLISGRERNLSHFCRVMGEDFASGLWVDLTKSGLKYTVSPVIIPESPISVELFTMAMDNISHQGEAQALVDNTDLSKCMNILDLGCGSAAYSIALCRRNPQLQAVGLDLPAVTAVTRKIVDENELDERITLKSGSWQEVDFTEEFDAVLLSDVLYEEEKTCWELINISQKALKKGGTLIIRGYFLTEEENRLFPALFDINLSRNNPKHRNYEVTTIVNWLQELNLQSIETKPLTELSYLITGYKPEVKQ